jgi:hypothetical protein
VTRTVRFVFSIGGSGTPFLLSGAITRSSNSRSRLNSRSQRFVGDHLGEYGDDDLVLRGPNLPHMWFSRETVDEKDPHIALVVWFHPDLAPDDERGGRVRRMETMLDRAARGLRFPRDRTASVRKRFKTLFSCPPTKRLLTLLSVLDELSLSSAEPLSSALPPTGAHLERRVDRILTYIHENYSHTISLTELARIGALSVSGLHRLFSKHTGRTISDYVAHMRIGEACAR